MAGQKILCGFFLLGILLTSSSAKKPSIAIAYQPEDLRAIVIDVIRSELAALDASSSSSPNALALKLQEMKSSVEEIKEALMLSSFVMENKVGETVEECGALRTSLIGNDSSTGLALSGNSIRDTLSTMSSDIAVIQSKLANSRNDVPVTTATPTTTPERTYSTTSFSRMTTTPWPDTPQYVSLTHFDELVRRKPTPLTGKTFNGSTVTDIMSSVSRVGDNGSGVVVVFINHLNRTINNFKMYDPKNTSIHAAPSSIAPHTKEVFTFAESRWRIVNTGFSYDIPGNTACISSFLNFHRPAWCGLAFKPKSNNMEHILMTRAEFPGAIWNKMFGTQQHAIRYQNLYAKISAYKIGDGKATVVIEIIEENNARNSGDIQTNFSGTTETTTTSERYETTQVHGSTPGGTGTNNVTSRPDIAEVISLTYFDDLVRRKPTPLTGKSFNGSTISDIMSRVSEVGDDGRGVVVVFINHLGQTINNFLMYDPKNSSLHAAPSSIAPHTKEVFTFAEPSVGYSKTTFSYDIPGNRAGISLFMDFNGADWFGVAFVPTMHNMEEYFTTQTGFRGLFWMELARIQQFALRYENLYAKMSANKIGTGKATVVIEIVEESNARISGVEFPGTTVFFDELVSRKPSPQQGKSPPFSHIIFSVSRVGEGGTGIVVVFINHLDRVINRFEMYDHKNSSLHAAPSSIAPHTKEVFAFAEPRCCVVRTAFSFNIPGSNASIASFMDFSYSAPSMGVAFVPTHQTMEQYYNSSIGYPGSSLSDKIRTQKLAVCYQNLYAKMSVNEMTSLVLVTIEIVEDLNGTTSEPPHSPTPDEYFPTEETVTEDYY